MTYPTTPVCVSGFLRRAGWNIGPSKDGRAPGRPPNGPVFNDIEAVALAAIAGLGLAQVPHYLAARAIADGRLRTVLADYAVSRGDIWLIRPPASSESPRVRVFATFLTKLIESI
ncbi:LysR substrate-binding domain-containing protein [Mesorhizobium kowhaii]|uniref:LysR substrate-binding domain-containing protein n=1 Tax=Mesorhizobium kowhaii TaxID=1300272 RepID=UPI0035EA2876